MKPRTLTVLLLLFFGGLLALWWAEWSGVPTAAERQRRAGVVLPALLDVPAAEIRRITIHDARGDILIERQGPRRWRLRHGSDTLADAARVESLLANLKTLTPLPDSGVLKEPPKHFGLGPEGRTVAVFGRDLQRPLATLELGQTHRDARYVRPLPGSNILIVDAKPLASLDLPAESWRETRLLPAFPMDVQKIVLTRQGQMMRLERGEEGWRIVAPFQAPAGDEAIGGLLADLAAMKVERFLDGSSERIVPPWLTVGIGTSAGNDPDLTLQVGAAIPGSPNHFEASRGGDLVEINGAPLIKLPTNPFVLRSKKALAFEARRVEWIVVREGEREHVLVRRTRGWVTLHPDPARPIRWPSTSFCTGSRRSKRSRCWRRSRWRIRAWTRRRPWCGSGTARRATRPRSHRSGRPMPSSTWAGTIPPRGNSSPARPVTSRSCP